MNIERIEIEHDKKVTVIFSLLYFIAIAGLGTCIALIGVNFAAFADSIGMGITIAMTVLSSVCVLAFFILFINQVAKLRRKFIFTADENGICDYSRHIVLKPIAYSEIRSIEYKEFWSDDATVFRHLKINLKDKCNYIKRLNFFQKISFFAGSQRIELTLFCGKTKLKPLAEKLKQNLEIYNQTKIFD